MHEQAIHEARCILVRHARPVIVPEASASSWTLAPDARADVERLAVGIRGAGGDAVIASPEPKACGTAGIIAECLGLPLAIDPAFREQGGDDIPFLSDADFVAAVAEHFAHPEAVVFGSETSAHAARRFMTAIDAALARHRCPIVVTHGRVMCGYLATALGVDPLPIWRDLRLPDAFLVDRADGTLERISG